ncbi:sensor histidine kinase [Arundinibacter roseus]|uniref:histidine kinase n=1 Tax=Arundinibacter roseus TaxID=2070510 RepID=A0A4R4KHD4_9BACT|nr:HAMP domain-containing sensor histidine kinase [Arundinibacter roseus]TDB65999.1 HAMP domain-containing histidine kinase [Arundinibacter roseus]
MTKQKIQRIVGLMCVALMGLIGFQWYFIREAIAVRNEQFNHKVAESVQKVVHRLEKQEMMYLLQQRIENEQQKSRLEEITKVNQPPKNRKKALRNQPAEAIALQPAPTGVEISVGPTGEISYQYFSEVAPSDVLSPNFRVMIDRQQRIIDEFFQAQKLGAAGLDEFVRRRLAEEQNLGSAMDAVAAGKSGDRLALTDHNQRTKPSQSAEKVPEKRGKVQNSVPEASYNPLPAKPVDKAGLLREVMQDLLYTQRPIEERVNRFLLDSLLKKEFTQNGISLPYEFAVRAQTGRNLLFSTVELYSSEWEQHAYKASLFPSEMLSGNNLLYVYFPDQKQFILQNMSVMFASSGILVLVILICFYSAVVIILRQKKLSDIKNDFINNMTHEFKTPISTIALATEMAHENMQSGKEVPDLTSRIDRYLGIIREENRRLGTHVEKVLQMALLDKGEVKLKRSLVNMHDVIAKVLNSLSVQIEQRQGVVEMDFEAVDELVEGDEVHLSNVLYNLVDNAIKYSPDTLHLTLSTQNEKGGIRMVVADQGMGLSSDQITRIFDKFYRVPTGNLHNVKGFGLGLSYVKKMVEAHKGSIQARSQPGKGSEFSFWLPTISPEDVQ